MDIDVQWLCSASSLGYSDFPAYSQILLRQLVYLKRVIVTPAVYQILGPLKRTLNYWHWADVTSHTNLCRFAGS